VFPVMAIADTQHPDALHAVLALLPQADWAIFISPNAVAAGFRHVGSFPSKVRFAAVGQGTARELRAAGCGTVLAPEGKGDSEALLELAPMQDVAGQTIMIFRGEGGREWLADTLRQRGATVHYAECYRRCKPDSDPTPLRDWLAAGKVRAVSITSNEILKNLHEFAGPQAVALRAVPHFVGHARIGELARSMGVAQVCEAGPGDAEMLAAIQGWFHHAG
jgi:uroporphyrinogen-III synthase